PAEALTTNALSRPRRRISAKSARRSLGDRSDSLSGNVPLQSTEQKRFVHISDILRSTNPLQCTLKWAHEPPSPATEGLRSGRQRDAVLALASLTAPAIGGCPIEANVALFRAKIRLKAH